MGPDRIEAEQWQASYGSPADGLAAAAAIRALAPGVRVEAVPAAATFVDLAAKRKAAAPTLRLGDAAPKEAGK